MRIISRAFEQCGGHKIDLLALKRKIIIIQIVSHKPTIRSENRHSSRDRFDRLPRTTFATLSTCIIGGK